MMLSPWLRFGKKIADANLNRLRRPFKLTYVVTKECHSRCANCKIWQHEPRGELTLEEVRAFARSAPHFSWIDFTGGEPTDRPDFVEVVGAFLESCPDLIYVHFPTNGLEPERIEKAARGILAQKPRRLVVTVSIDGPPRENDALRGIKGDFERATRTLAALRKLEGLEAYAGMTLYPRNVGLVRETAEAIAAAVPGFTIRELHVNVPHVSGHYYGNSRVSANAAEFNDRLIAAVDDLMRLRGLPVLPFGWVERLYQKRVPRYLATGQCPQDCGSLLASCYLSENGTLYPCSIWDEPLGNIRDTGYRLEPLLDSPKARDLRQRILAKDCPGCWTPCEAYPTMASNLGRLAWG